MKVIKICFYRAMIFLCLAVQVNAMDSTFLCDALQELSESQDTVRQSPAKRRKTNDEAHLETPAPTGIPMPATVQRPNFIFIQKTIQDFKDEVRSDHKSKTRCAWCTELVSNCSLRSHLLKNHQGVLGQIIPPGDNYPKTYKCFKCNCTAHTLPTFMRHFNNCNVNPIETHLAELQTFLYSDALPPAPVTSTLQESVAYSGNGEDPLRAAEKSIPEKHLRVINRPSMQIINSITGTVNFELLAQRTHDFSWCPICFKKLKEKNNEESLINHFANSIKCKDILGKVPCNNCHKTKGSSALFTLRCCPINRLTELIGPTHLLFYKPTNESELVSELIRIKSIIEPVTGPA